jgi:poly-gamma-glutamate synthesis protein (capsule biosynthesis protein)
MTCPTLAAVGDISFGDHLACASFGVDSMLRALPKLDVFEHVQDLLSGHHVVFGNLETVLSEAGLDSTSLRSMHMRGRPAYIEQLANAGFNVVNVANNHILQHGRRAFEETIELLESRGILPVGVATPDRERCQPARIEVGGTELVFLGYGFETDKYFVDVPLYARGDRRIIVDDVRRVKTNSNVVICSFHWGNEFISYPSLEQIAIAREAIDAGCDLILGHHSHVLNGFECYKGKYIFYSLGNFVFDQLWNDDCTLGMAVKLRLSTHNVQLVDADCIRIGRDYRPTVVRDGRFDQTLERLCAQIDRTVRNEGNGYAREVRRKEARNRYLSWLYLFRYVYRYDPRILTQIITETLLRKVGGRGHRATAPHPV